MKNSNIDLFDSNYVPRASSPSRDSNFGFAFDDSNFSDRLLRLEIVDDETESNFARKKRMKEEKKTDNNDDNLDSSSSTMMMVKTLHISSPILAAKSPFFYKLFSNGMKESNERVVTIRINASEEAAFMELLNFMYTNSLSLSVTTPSALLDVLMAADKYQVPSCMRYCIRLLRTSSMSPESALLFLELPSSVLMAEAFKSLADAAKHYLSVRYKDITKYQEEILAFPLSGIEAILSRDDLQVASSEDAVFEFVLKWTRAHYPLLEERREVIAARLGRFIRFSCMSSRKLEKVLACHEFHHDAASKLGLEALN